MIKRVVNKTALVAGLTLALSGGAMAKETVNLTELSWDGALAINAVLKVILEDKFDVEVKSIAVDQSAAWAAMDKGDGSIDVVPDMWTPAHNDKMAKYVAPGGNETVIVNGQPYTGIQGMFIPGYIQDEHNVRSITDLAKPEVAKLFDLDGDGMGDYWPGDPGWGSQKIEIIKAKSYGYDQTFKPMLISDAIFKAQLKDAFRKKKGIAFYYWTPEWIHAEFDLRQLEEPAFDGYSSENKKDDPQYKADGCWKHYSPDETDQWLEKSSITCAWEDAKVYVAHSKALAKRLPKVSQFLTNIAFDPADINAWILKVGMEKQDAGDVAKAWVQANQAKIDAWMAGL